jgi:hypothetical protein
MLCGTTYRKNVSSNSRYFPQEEDREEGSYASEGAEGNAAKLPVLAYLNGYLRAFHSVHGKLKAQANQ